MNKEKFKYYLRIERFDFHFFGLGGKNNPIKKNIKKLLKTE